MRVQLLNQTLLDLGLYDDGPYEVADQKQLNAQLIPVPYHSYLGRICPRCSLLPVHRREGEGREGTTLRGYRVCAPPKNQPGLVTKAKPKKKAQNVPDWQFPMDYFQWRGKRMVGKSQELVVPIKFHL